MSTRNDSLMGSPAAQAMHQKPRILIVTDTFSADGADGWLFDSLAAELARSGVLVDVFVLDRIQALPHGLSSQCDGRVRVRSFGPKQAYTSKFGKLSAYIIASLQVHTWGFKHLKQEEYDACVFASVAITTSGLPARVRRAGRTKKLIFILWDFFPVHHAEIGRLRRSPVLHVLKMLERLAINPCDVIFTMTPFGTRFLQFYHSGLKANVQELLPWTARHDIQTVKRQEVFTAVFGGQLSSGRGVRTLIEAAEILERRNESIRVEIYGSGSERESLRDFITVTGLRNCEIFDPLPRADYLSRLASAHLGVAVTVPDVTIPSFPSKIADYCQVGLPVVACVEASTDAGLLLERSGAGVSTPAGDAESLANAISGIAREYREGTWGIRSESAKRFFQERMTVESAVEKILDQLS